MEFAPGFQTPRLNLRPIAVADAGPIFDGYAQDADATRYLTWRPHLSIRETEVYIVRCLIALSSRTYAIVGRHDGRLVGALDLRLTGPSRMGCGYVLARSAWGKGLMTEALTVVVDWALAQPDIWRIGDVCDIDNPASGRVMEKAGMTFEGVLRRWVVHPNVSGEPRDCLGLAKVR